MGLLRRLIESARFEAREYRRYRRFKSRSTQVRRNVEGGCVDSVVIHRDGTIAAYGWAMDLGAFAAGLRVRVDGRDLEPTHAFRVWRADVAAQLNDSRGFLGAVIEWILPPRATSTDVQLLFGHDILSTFGLPALHEPAYSHLRTETRVLGREQIYGFGPPVPEVSAEVIELARALPPPVLDFGCGAGALVRELRARNIEAYGLELDTPRIHEYLLGEVKPFVTFYNGSLPSPFATNQFSSVVCSEVLEHIRQPETLVWEIARLASTAVLVTVPDMSAIPRGFHHGVVPWHLLESTHCNFFTQHSLQEVLRPLGTGAEMARIGLMQCDRVSYYTSLAAVVRRDDTADVKL